MSRICVGSLFFAAVAMFDPCPDVLLAQEKPSPVPVWEYKVLTKENVVELGQKDLAAGLNQLGRDGWELTAVDGVYIFKRSPLSVPQLKMRLERMKADVEQWQDRAAWSARMANKGIVSRVRADADRARLRIAEISLESAKKELASAPKEMK